MIKIRNNCMLGLLVFAFILLNCDEETTSNVPVQKSCLERAIFGEPSESVYILPYSVGESFELVQSYCAPSNSHSNQLAYDFIMPIGVSIIASRSGIVRELREDQKDSEPGGNPIGTHNHLNIQHEDGSVAFYAHLKEESVFVEVGDTIIVGDTIALSGNSGTSLPHLHFGVYRTWPAIEGDDLAVNFRNTDGPLDENGGLITAESYEALIFDIPAKARYYEFSEWNELDRSK